MIITITIIKPHTAQRTGSGPTTPGCREWLRRAARHEACWSRAPAAGRPLDARAPRPAAVVASGRESAGEGLYQSDRPMVAGRISPSSGPDRPQHRKPYTADYLYVPDCQYHTTPGNPDYLRDPDYLYHGQLYLAIYWDQFTYNSALARNRRTYDTTRTGYTNNTNLLNLTIYQDQFTYNPALAHYRRTYDTTRTGNTNNANLLSDQQRQQRGAQRDQEHGGQGHRRGRPERG